MSIRLHLLCMVAGLTLAVPAAGQDWSWPDKPENLKVLPKEFDGQRLRPVMVGFTNALGVRCSHCHVGEEGKPLSTYDFASDANPNKDRARAMLNMLQMINGELRKIEPSGPNRVNMWCHTCHRGRPRPMSLGEELTESYEESGASAAVAHYRELREKFYGLGSYKFDESALNSLGYKAIGKEDFEGALMIFAENAERYPESANAWDSLAEANFKSGHLDKARSFYEKSLELDPKNDNAKKMLVEIEKAVSELAK